MDANALILLVAVSAVSPGSMADSVATFSQLGPRDELRVHFHANGCFYDTRYNLVFRGGDAPSVSIATVSTTLSRYMHQAPGVPVLSSALSDTMLAGLDGLLRFYRSRPPGRCTSSEEIEMVQLHDGAIVAQERFRDGSCASTRTPGVYSLSQLIGRVQFGPGPGR